VNILIAGILFVALGGLLPPESAEIQNPHVSLLGRLLSANLFLAVFNLVPAFPMDGGRVLRAVLAHWLGYARGTQIAARVGQVLAFGLGLLGLFGNPILLFIAVFVYLGAASEAHAAQMRQVSNGMIASDAMIRHFQPLHPGSEVEDAVRLLIETTQHEFPVVDGAGHLRGVLTRDDMIKALRERGPDAPVLEIMRTDIPIVRARQCLADAFRVMQEQHAVAVAAYALSPIDLIPDFIPIFGQDDDLLIIPAGIFIALKLIPPEIMSEHLAAAFQAERQPSSRAAAAVIHRDLGWCCGAFDLGLLADRCALS
jgi:uncharacterized membrane protein YkvA (DUF1232 family)